MLKLYRKSQEAQLQWIKDHPIQYVVLNVVLFGMFLVYMEWRDRKFMREFENDVANV